MSRPRIILPTSELKRLIKQDYAATKIAKYYGVSIQTILNVFKRQRIKYRKWNYGFRSPGWKKGWWIDKDGYKMVFVPRHPNRTYKAYVREHRLIMEKHLKRYLKKTEVVHHKNGNKLDNRISNLELFSRNGDHLRTELTGQVPRWTRAGKKRMRVGILKGVQKRGWKLSAKNVRWLSKNT